MIATSFIEFIEQKTPEKLAIAFEASEHTITSWRQRKLIPRARWPDLLLKFPEIGMTDLMSWERGVLGRD